MAELEKVIKGMEQFRADLKPFCGNHADWERFDAGLSMLKEQEKKQITLHKKHVITWGRNDKFSIRNLYEAICETLLDEGELFIARTDDHEKVDFLFYVAEGR